MAKLPEHLCPQYDAAPYPECVVKGLNYRFTVITPRLIRIEYSENGVFEDGATQSFINRKIGKPEFTVCNEENLLTIETDELILKYKKEGKFNSYNLSIKLKKFISLGVEDIWFFGEQSKNLGGTARTLDTADGAIPLEDGVCSRAGFACIDDSKSNLILSSGKTAPRPDGIIDMYFFGYGRDYLAAVGDLMRLTGVPSLLPAYALGNWWSRYWSYTQEEYKALMQKFIDEDIPFSVAVIDMGWHYWDIRDDEEVITEYGSSWTGYTWDKNYFPDHVELLKWLHDNNLSVTLNLHPALGIRPNEKVYREFAEAMGMDPDEKKTISFDMTNENFIKAYFELAHNTLEDEGVDFWWMDWQQGSRSNTPGLDPLWLLNHYHTLDSARNGRRPMLFSRYSGIGSQRFSIGFSGDSAMTWNSLDFQPYFTATASNAAYPWWSHDIGGHYSGYRDDELNTRWVQLGVFSPILRLHSGNNPYSSKEPWNYGLEADVTMRKFLKLRHNLIPYTYTMNYRTHTELIPICCPVYYYHPNVRFAYNYKNSFFFGSEMLIMPVTQKADAESKRARVDGWLPEGIWFDFFRGIAYEGGRRVSLYRTLDEIPVLCKAGAIIPMTDKKHGDNSIEIGTDLVLNIFPMADNSFKLYEDAGDGFEYQNGAFAQTEFSLKWSEKPEFTIHAVSGDASFVPEKRNYKLVFKCISADTCVYLDGKKLDGSYDKDHATLTVCIDDIATDKDTVLTLTSECGFVPDNSAKKYQIDRVLLDAQKKYNSKLEVFRAMDQKKFSDLEILRIAMLENLGDSVVGALAENFEG